MNGQSAARFVPFGWRHERMLRRPQGILDRPLRCHPLRASAPAGGEPVESFPRLSTLPVAR
jgi:hypothetical protein